VSYILYYSLAFIVITHAWPFFAIASRDKDIIDALHHAQDVISTMLRTRSPSRPGHDLHHAQDVVLTTQRM